MVRVAPFTRSFSIRPLWVVVHTPVTWVGGVSGGLSGWRSSRDSVPGAAELLLRNAEGVPLLLRNAEGVPLLPRNAEGVPLLVPEGVARPHPNHLAERKSQHEQGHQHRDNQRDQDRPYREQVGEGGVEFMLQHPHDETAQ